jgi:hypothetical protein
MDAYPFDPVKGSCKDIPSWEINRINNYKKVGPQFIAVMVEHRMSRWNYDVNPATKEEFTEWVPQFISPVAIKMPWEDWEVISAQQKAAEEIARMQREAEMAEYRKRQEERLAEERRKAEERKAEVNLIRERANEVLGLSISEYDMRYNMDSVRLTFTWEKIKELTELVASAKRPSRGRPAPRPQKAR